jgi:hypothetical protein
MFVFACLEKLVALKSSEQKMRSIVTAQEGKIRIKRVYIYL